MMDVKKIYLQCFFDKKTMGGLVKNEIERNKESAEEQHQPIIRKFEKPKVRSSFMDSIQFSNLAHMQQLNKFNNRICFYCFVVDIYSNYALVIPLKKTSITISNAFHR